MAIVGLGVASLFAYAASSTSNAADREMATAIAQQRMEQLRSAAFSDLSLTASTVVTTETRLGREYSVTTTIVGTTANMKTITVSVVPLASNAKWASNVNTVFASVTLVSNRTAQSMGENREL